MNQLILIGFTLFSIWLIKRDTASREGISAALWIPTIWVGILASRPLSTWVGFGGGEDTLDGSPLDRYYYLTMIIASMMVLSKRGVDWVALMSRNWPIVLFYSYLLVSVVWANSPFTSFKRWFKEIGNIFVVLVVLTEVNPIQALRAVFVRCAYVLIPLSIIFIRYFPELGRRYSRHSGQMEATGVTFQKNSLGSMVLVCGLIFVWDWLERSRPDGSRSRPMDRFLPPVLATIGAWLIFISDSKTSMLCLVIGIFIVSAVRMPLLHRRINALGAYVLAGTAGYFALDWMFGISASILASLGRDMTFTGRTDVWRELFNVHTDPVIGTGYLSFWDDPHYRAILPDWVGASAHNGYLDVYLAGGVIGVGILALMILVTGARINRALAEGGHFAVARFAIYVAMLLANVSETNFACMTPLGFLFLLAAIGSAHPQWPQSTLGEAGQEFRATPPPSTESEVPLNFPV